MLGTSSEPNDGTNENTKNVEEEENQNPTAENLINKEKEAEGILYLVEVLKMKPKLKIILAKFIVYLIL